MLGRAVWLCGLMGVAGLGLACSMESGNLETTTLPMSASAGKDAGGADGSGPSATTGATDADEHDDELAAQCTAADESKMDRRGLVCHRWRCDGRGSKTAAPWPSGDANSCAAGAADEAAGERALRVLNMHRFLAGLEPVAVQSAWDGAAQQCALVAHANAKLSHFPTRDWKCWSDLAAQTSAVSLIANRSAPIAIGAFFEDPGNEISMVHRRWLLSEDLKEVAVGTTDRYSCVVVAGDQLDIVKKITSTLTGSSSAGAGESSKKRTWSAWPPAGPVPMDLLTTERVDEMGWTLQSSTDVLDRATVTVSVRLSKDSVRTLPVKVTHLTPLLGSKSAVRFVPSGWKTEAGVKYTVKAKSGNETAIELDVEPVSCE